MLSRQAGGRAAGDAGIGSRGPGETKIEMDRRVIRNASPNSANKSEQMAPARDVKRGARRRFGLPTVAVVGYTNRSKSVVDESVDRISGIEWRTLFATLDTAVRRARAKDGRQYAYVDTVGFVRRLPTQLIEAFKSTLKEVSRSRSDRACGGRIASGPVLAKSTRSTMCFRHRRRRNHSRLSCFLKADHRMDEAADVSRR